MRFRRKSSENLPSGEITGKERLITKIMSDKYKQKLSAEIITGNYHRKLSAYILSREKCGNYRDTGVSKKCYVKRICRVQINASIHRD